MNTTAYFDPAEEDTPAGMEPALAYTDISDVPSEGTGLAGAAYVPGTKIWNIDMARVAADGDADAEFVSTELGYAAKYSDTTISEFLGADADSLDRNGDLEMGPSALSFTGFIYIPPGVHEITVVSDDGFDLNIGGVDFSEYATGRSTDETPRVADFEGGLYQVELLYFDSGGGMSLSLQIDGLPVDQSAFYQSENDFTDQLSAVPTVLVDDYHPSFFLGEGSLETPVNTTTTDGRDVV
ncbi:MAG: hypothetical protein GKR98_10865 [Boseongicola sp.]|nr:MAG: hypothetical protein GKR98_10865 [Boseongicola sp.]